MPDNVTSGRWIVPLLFAGGSACAAATVGLALDHFGVRLKQLGLPFSSILWLALLTGVSGFISGRVYHAQQLKRAAAMEDPIADDPTCETTDKNLPAMPVFADQVAIYRRRTETVGDVTVDVFDLTTESSDGDGDTDRITRTIALMPAVELPPFELRPLNFQHSLFALFGAVGLTFDESAPGTLDGQALVAQFGAMYRLTIVSEEAMIAGTADADEKAVRQVFPLQTIRKLLGRNDWSVQSHGGFLACWVATDALGPKRRERLVADAVALRAVLLAAHAGVAGEVVAAPPGVATVQRQAARLQASLLGGLFGALAGFFAAVLLDFGEVFGTGNGSAVFPIAIVCGVLLGVTVGRLLPFRRPLLRKPKDERREKIVGCALLAGLFGGIFAGCIAGAVIIALIGLKIDDHKPRQLLFFGCVGVGAFLGSVVLGVTTNFLYPRMTGRRDKSTTPKPRQKS